METVTRRLLAATAGFGTLVCAGAAALWALGRGSWQPGDTLWMSLTSVTTVGFGELPGMSQRPGARVVVGVLVLFGVAALAWFQSTITTALIEGMLGRTWRNRRMRKTIEAMRGHVVVAGVGRTGSHVVEELLSAGTPFVVLDRSDEFVEKLAATLGVPALLHVRGDATHDSALLAAGVDRAAGVIAALTDDRDNLYVTLSARSLNPTARIVAKVVEAEAEAKMLRAGANATVSPNMLGGRRLAREVVHPDVLATLDQLLRSRGEALHFRDFTVGAHSPLLGKLLGEAEALGATRARVVGVRVPGKGLSLSLDDDTRLVEGTVLVALGTGPELRALAAALHAKP